MGKGGGRRDWMQVYAIYGIGEWQLTLSLLLFAGAVSAVLSLLSLLYFSPILSFAAARSFAFLPLPFLRFLLGLSGSLAALVAIFLLSAAANILHSSLGLHWHMCQRVTGSVPDWSSVRAVLDVGCGRGMLLNSVAMQLKKEGSCGRVVGLDHRRETAVTALRTASVEGVQEYVTCREGDARHLPFPDRYFDVVVSALHLSGVGKDNKKKKVADRKAVEGERGKCLAEVVRVMKPGGVGVVWDLMYVPEYARRLSDMGMEDIRVSERVTAYMVGSHLVSFQKPKEAAVAAAGEDVAE